MALIKCKECGNEISDQAYSCPKCGYEINGNFKSNRNDNKSKNKNMYVIGGIILIIIGIWYFTNGKNTLTETKQTDPDPSNPTEGDYQTHQNSYLGISFKYLNGYKVATGDDNLIYISKEIKDNAGVIPYVLIGRFDSFTSEISFLNSFTEYMKKEYGSNITVSQVKIGTIGGKTVYAANYSYSLNNYKIIDNRYVILLNNKVYMVGSKEANTSSQEINNLAELVITSLTEGGN